VDFYSPRDARFLINAAENVHFKKSVKYILKSALNHEGGKTGRVFGTATTKITSSEHGLNPFKALVKALSPNFDA
jgi:hypothetical protein